MDMNMPFKTLKLWFVVHFVVDFVIAVPLFFFPESFLSLFGWKSVDPLMSRIVASALFGIGGISLIARNSSRETFTVLLNLKIIWSLCAIIGFAVSIFTSDYPAIVWLFLLTFVLFSVTWAYYRIRIG